MMNSDIIIVIELDIINEYINQLMEKSHKNPMIKEDNEALTDANDPFHANNFDSKCSVFNVTIITFVTIEVTPPPINPAINITIHAKYAYDKISIHKYKLITINICVTEQHAVTIIVFFCLIYGFYHILYD